MLILLFIVVLIISIWYHLKFVPPEKNMENARKMKDGIISVAFGAAVGLAMSMKEDKRKHH